MKKTNHRKQITRRNPLHSHPLLSKSSVHQKTYKAKRRLDNIKIKKEWLPQSALSTVTFGKAALINS